MALGSPHILLSGFFSIKGYRCPSPLPPPPAPLTKNHSAKKCYLGVKCPRAFLVHHCHCAKLPHYFCETNSRKRGFLYFSEAAELNALFKAQPEGWDADWLDQWGSSSRRRASAKPDVGNVWLFLYFTFWSKMIHIPFSQYLYEAGVLCRTRILGSGMI